MTTAAAPDATVCWIAESVLASNLFWVFRKKRNLAVSTLIPSLFKAIGGRRNHSLLAV